MKLNATARKAISVFLVLLLSAGLYGAIIALCNQYLREHYMLTKSARFVLCALMFAGFYFIYRWFSKRIDTIGR